MSAYRDEGASFAMFAQHVGIAVTLLEGGDADTWDAVWDQLAQARAIAVHLGRDAAAFEAARAHADDPDAAPREVTARMWDAARDAVDALRAAVPEVVVPGAQRPPRVPVTWRATQAEFDQRARRDRCVVALWILIAAIVHAFTG